jgi:hypothetical protein
MVRALVRLSLLLVKSWTSSISKKISSVDSASNHALQNQIKLIPYQATICFMAFSNAASKVEYQASHPGSPQPMMY